MKHTGKILADALARRWEFEALHRLANWGKIEIKLITPYAVTDEVGDPDKVGDVLDPSESPFVEDPDKVGEEAPNA